MGDLDGRVALITGAGRGIGAATARRLAAKGARVLVNDRDAAEAASTVDAILAAGGEATALVYDLTRPDAADVLVDAALAEAGGLDILVNNAGYVWNGAIQNHSDEQWQAMLDMHAGVPFRILRAWQPWLRDTANAERVAHGGARCRKVVNISSVSGTTGAATQIAYSAGKAAVVGITKTLAKEWGRFNVTVNSVAFGHIDTRLTQTYAGVPPSITVGERAFRVGLSEEQAAAVRAATPLGRTGSPEDAAGAIVLFCLPESDFVTGQVLTCSGGA
ncbi:MAG: SDR family oxidoreductase [Pseudomonadales bacterium]|nr:SDR family oxidoreductase [Pseudomonadales bacterium]MCP5186095.1 SDR family oxidoreductase [Pseudomonadales bacterium]